MNYQQRIADIIAEMQEQNVEALFISSKELLYYFCGIIDSSHERITLLGIHRTKGVGLFVPMLSAAKAEQNKAGIKNITAWSDTEGSMRKLADWFSQLSLESKRIAIDGSMPSAFLLQCQSATSSDWIDGSALMGKIMARKDMEELSALQKASKATCDVYPQAICKLMESPTETALAVAINNAIYEMGGEPSFDTIVAAGANGALPHHHPGYRQIEKGDVVIMDYGVKLDHYCGDYTRTVALGSASIKAQDAYKVVLEAHHKAREAIKPGVPAELIDKAARNVIDKAGLGEAFIHRTGHGIGLHVHEAPFIVEGNTELLQSGNVFSIEPGVYLPGEFGIRIENLVAVTDNGHISLNSEPPETLPIV